MTRYSIEPIFSHSWEIYPKDMEKTVLDTATKTGIDATKTAS